MLCICNELVHELPVIKNDTVFIASYTATTRTYEIIFEVNGIEYTELYEYGITPSYKGEYEFTANNIKYKIVGWDKEFIPVNKSAKYIANVSTEGSADYCNITFDVSGDTLVIPTLKNTNPTFYGIPYKKPSDFCTYEFIGWFDGETTYDKEQLLPLASGEVTYYALFDEIYKYVNITYYLNNEVIHISSAKYGDIPSYTGDLIEKYSDQVYDYIHNGWECDGVVYTDTLPYAYKDANYHAVFEKVLKTYTLTINYIKDDQIISSKYYYNFGDSFYINTPTIEGYSTNALFISGILYEDTIIDVQYINSTPWDGQEILSFDNGLGTENEPYVISSGAHLAYLAQEVDNGNTFKDKYFKLTNNIDLGNHEWNPIGNYSNTFEGSFDGNNNAIINFTYSCNLIDSDANSSVGLFSNNSGIIKNLVVYGNATSTVKNSAIISGLNAGIIENVKVYGALSGYTYCGGIAGKNDGVINNCINICTISAKNSGTHIAGIAGYNTENSSINNCVNEGNISATNNYISGIVGYSLSIVSNSNNYGLISGNNYVAGICSYTSSDIINCGNYSFINGKKYVAGITGYSTAVIDKCVNYGRIVNTSTQTAGIAGYSTGIIKNSINNGDITSSSTSLGGIVGGMKPSSADSGIFDCENTGTIYSKCTGSNAVTGGIAGRIDYNGSFKPTIKGCHNKGKVYSNASYTGGIVGACNGGIVITSINSAFVNGGAGAYIGGIAGSNYASGDVNNCTNYGVVVGGSSVGQICGQLTSTSSSTSNNELGKKL